MNLWLSRSQGVLRMLLLIGICYSAADLTAARIERRLQIAATRTTTVNSTTNVTTVNPAPPVANTGDLQSVLNTTVPPLPSPTPMLASAQGPGMPGGANTTAVVSGPAPKLTGTLAGAGHSLAVLSAGNETKVAGIGEVVNGWTVVEVEQYSCTLRDPNGNNVTLTMDLANLNGPSTAQAPPPTVASPVVNATVANATPGVPVSKPGTLSSAELKDMLTHTERYIQNIQVKAMRKGDEVIGMQVNYSNPDNPFAKLGVTNGDVISSLNGHPLKGPEDLSWALGELRNAQSLNFQIDRNGQTVPLTVQLTEP